MTYLGLSHSVLVLSSRRRHLERIGPEWSVCVYRRNYWKIDDHPIYSKISHTTNMNNIRVFFLLSSVTKTLQAEYRLQWHCQSDCMNYCSPFQCFARAPEMLREFPANKIYTPRVKTKGVGMERLSYYCIIIHVYLIKKTQNLVST